MNSKRKFPAWLVELTISAAVFFAVAASRGVFSEKDPVMIYLGLCDAFFVPGAMMFCIGILSYTASHGAYDIFGYALKSLKVLFTPFGKPEKHQRYYEYKLEKEMRQKKNKPWSLLIGLGFLAAAGLCLVLFNMAGG